MRLSSNSVCTVMAQVTRDMLLRIALINLVVFITVANSSSRESESAYFCAVSIPADVEVFKAEQENKSSIVVCSELDIRFSNYVQRSCRKKIKGHLRKQQYFQPDGDRTCILSKRKEGITIFRTRCEQNLLCRIKSYGGESAEILIINITTYCSSRFEIRFFGAIDSNIWSLFADETTINSSDIAAILMS